MRRAHSSLPWLLALGLASCAGAAEYSSGEAEPESPASVAMEQTVANAARPTEAERDAPFDSRFVDQVRTVVSRYPQWGRVDDEARWAPYLCRMPRAARAHVSESDDPSTHGHKLYTVYALDPEAYGARRSDGPAVPLPGMQQVIVKESFAPEPYSPDGKAGIHPGGGVGTHRLQPAVRDGQKFIAGDRRGLYVMMKPEGNPEGTDEGWIYATVEPDMVTVTAVGVIESCADCHAEAGQGRLFGLPGLAEATPPPPAPRNVDGPPL